MPRPAPTKILRTVDPAPKLRVVGEAVPTPLRLKNDALRPREYLTPQEVDRLVATARRRGRYSQRDATAILICYRHGLRVSELCALTWSQIDFSAADMQVKRAKGGKVGVHPLTGAELRSLRQLRREWPEGRHVFVNERGAPMTPTGFARMLERVGVEAGLAWKVHPHMLRQPPDLSSQMTAVIPARSKITWGTGQFNRRSARPDLSAFGAIEGGRTGPRQWCGLLLSLLMFKHLFC